MRTAHRLQLGNPALTEDMGRLYDWGSANKAPDNPATVAFREQALVYFRLAARQRITSPYTWSNIASIKLKLRQVDAELFHALKLSAMLGPWEPEVQIAVADAGLAMWAKLPDDMRDLVRENFERGMQRQAAEMLRIAQSHKQLGVICSIKGRPGVSLPSSCDTGG